MRQLILGTMIAGILGWSVPATAQLTITETQSLDFGTFITRDFNSISQVTISANTGGTSVNANTIAIALGQRAEYTMSGAPANTSYTLTIDSDTDLSELGLGAGNLLTLDNFTVFPTTLLTDGAGNDFFYLGAQLQSAGGGAVYTDASYSGSYTFTVMF